MLPEITAVVLAAGKGTRMKSGRAKVLHEVFFKPMLHHVLESIREAGIARTVVIVGHQREQVQASIDHFDFTPVIQEEQLGTGHAVLCTKQACRGSGLVMILCGDTPLIRARTLRDMINAHCASGATVTLMTTILDDPFGYGRIITDDQSNILEIVEQKDATLEQQAIREINAGIYLVDEQFLFSALGQVGTDNSQGEVYLTDIISIARREGHSVHAFVHPESIDVLGVNSRIELARAHAELQKRFNNTLMLKGITMYTPETVLVAPDSEIGNDTVLQAGVQVTGNSKIGREVVIQPGAVVHHCTIGDGAVIGANCVLHNTSIEAAEHIPPLTYRVG